MCVSIHVTSTGTHTVKVQKNIENHDKSTSVLPDRNAFALVKRRIGSRAYAQFMNELGDSDGKLDTLHQECHDMAHTPSVIDIVQVSHQPSVKAHCIAILDFSPRQLL